MRMKKDRTIYEYCQNCDEELEMTIVQRDQSNPHLVWVRCPKCSEIKPVDIHQLAEEIREEISEEALLKEDELDDEEQIEPRAPISPVKFGQKQTKKKKGKNKKETKEETDYKIEKDRAREYQISEGYKIGETIHHSQWRDYGVVLRVRKSGGGREMMEVRFEKQGIKRLLIHQKS